MKSFAAMFGLALLSVQTSWGESAPLYQCSFDSADAVRQSVAGGAGQVFDSATFVPGVSGNAMRVPQGVRAAAVDIPAFLMGEKGCIEFWAKIEKTSSTFSTGGDPRFFNMVYGNGSWLMFQFASNNGGGNSGVEVWFPAGGLTSRKGFASTLDYSCVFGTGAYDAWHHWALVWNRDGIRKLAADGKIPGVALMLDEAVLASVDVASFNVAELQAAFATPATLNFPLQASDDYTKNKSPFLIDEFKIWGEDRTEFTAQPSVTPPVTNFVYVTVTNVVEHHTTVTNVVEHHHYTTVTNVVEHHHYTTVTNVVEYVPAPGASPAPVYAAQAGAATSRVIAGAAGWDVLDLPEGMTWDAATGTLGGTPVRSGTYDLILVSGSGAGTKMMRTTVAVEGFEPIVAYVGTAFAWTGAPVTLFADYKNLPAGLKWAPAAGTLAGVPKKAGDYSRATAYGDAVAFSVLDLPETAVGTFNGLVSLDGTNYPVAVTATKAGKLAAKIAVGTKTLSLSAASWSGWRRADGHLLLAATCTAKTNALELVLDADAPWNADQMALTVTGGTLAGATGAAQRADFASGPAKDAAEAVAGSYTFMCEPEGAGFRLVAPEGGKVGAMSVVLKPAGTAALKGKYDGKTSVSANATLHVDAEGTRSLTFFHKGVQFSWTW